MPAAFDRRHLALLVLGASLCAQAQSSLPDRFSAGGYFRVMTRPDFEGGNSKLGLWNLYGRLLNEGPWGSLELKLDVLQAPPGSNEVWASVHTRVEGGSFQATDPAMGALSQFRVTQLYVQAGNVLLERVRWRLGTLEYYEDLGLYDVRLFQLFGNTAGLSATYSLSNVDVLLGVGDSGYALRGAQYSTVLTSGGALRVRLGGHLDVAAGGQYLYEPSVKGNRFAPHVTPGVGYEDFLRGEVAKSYVQANPNREEFFPHPEPTSSRSWRVTGMLGFGNLGPLKWNKLLVNYTLVHPESFKVEEYQGRSYPIYLAGLTDERYELNLGNEMQLTLWPGRLDAVWGVLYGHHVNRDNTLAAGEDNRRFYSTVLRLQGYLTRTVHLLAESSLAQEVSLNGRLFREHADSVFRNRAGVSDSRGLEYGDTDTRNTWQLKAGVVFNPTGLGIYTRPSLRLLYGLQYSNVQAAFGNGFVDSLDQYNLFASPERHWHSVVAIEAEAWF